MKHQTLSKQTSRSLFTGGLGGEEFRAAGGVQVTVSTQRTETPMEKPASDIKGGRDLHDNR